MRLQNASGVGILHQSAPPGVSYNAGVFYTAVFRAGVLALSYMPNRGDSMQMSPIGVLPYPRTCPLCRLAPGRMCTAQVCFC